MTGTEILPALDPPPPNIDQAESTRRWRGYGPWSVRKVGLVIGIVLAGLTAAYVIALLMVGGNIPRGTTVAGVDIGGLTPTAAEERLNAELAPATADVVVELAGRSRTIPATKLGVSFDAASTVQGIERRSYLPWELARQLTGTTVPPVVTSGRQLDRLVASLAKRVDEEPRQGRVRYDDMEIVTVPPKPGQALDEETAREAIIDGYLAADDPIELAVVAVQPDVTAQQIQQVAEGAAVEAISAPITLTVADRTIEISPEQIAEVLTFRPVDGAMSAVVDTAELRSGLDTELASIGTPARDASFDVSSGKPVVIPAERGRGVSDDTLGDGLVDALSDSSRSADLPIGPIPADLTTAEAKHLGVHRVISTFTQVFPYAAYRVTNIGLASEKINGTVLEPGETFSLNGVVGERTPENGFVKGYVIVGNRLVEDYGGAVSTMTTAVWHTAFYAGMTRIEQRAHGYWISRYLPGLEATVSWGNLDLKFRNETPYGVLITTSVSDTSVTVTMWSTKYWDIRAEFGPRTNPRPAGTVYDPGEGCVAQYGVDGFDITVTRVWSRDGEVKRREPLDTSYTSAPTVICAPEPTPEPKPDNSDKPKPDNSDKPKPSPSDSPSPDNTGGGGGGDNSG